MATGAAGGSMLPGMVTLDPALDFLLDVLGRLRMDPVLEGRVVGLDVELGWAAEARAAPTLWVPVEW